MRDVVEVFAVTLNVTPALPLVFGPAPVLIAIHEALLAAVHWQPLGMVTDTTRVPPAATNDSLVDDSEPLQGAAACVIVNSFPPAAMVPVREVPAGLGSTRYVTVPLPVPVAPVSTVIQDTLETPVHAQPPGRLTATLPFPPASLMFWVVGDNVASQVAPAWVMTNCCPATVIVTERGLLLVFAATT